MRRTLGLAAVTTPVIVLAVLSIAVAPHGPLVAALMALSITAVGAVGALVTIAGRGGTTPGPGPGPPDDTGRSPARTGPTVDGRARTDPEHRDRETDVSTPDEHLAPIERDLLREPGVVQDAALALSRQLRVDCTAPYAGLRRSAQRARMPLPDVALVVVRRRWDRASGDSEPG